MTDRMTDRDLARLDVPGIGDDVRMMARELIERRAADLSAEEIGALRLLAADVREFGVAAPNRQYRSRDEEYEAQREWTVRCLAVLDKLVVAGGKP